jgi:fibro-slime domain-containing protein
MLCNLWPYWENWSGCSGDQWDPVAEEQVDSDGMERNFYFTTEARYLLVYRGGESLEFFGDDDVWVFINGKLALDLGGTHQQLRGKVTLDDGGDSRFGLEIGNVYEIVVFHADRHPRDSNYQLTLSGFETERSICQPECGNGVATLTEECDLGEENNDETYGGCRTDCTWGPFCGDGIPNGPEECDDGMNTTVEYGAEGCAPGCVEPPRCGNGRIELVEQCDDGPNNQDGVEGACSTECKINPKCGDGVVMAEAGEQCDLGEGNQPPEEVNYGGCTTECKLGPYCGDGVENKPQEQCDDGNTIPNDGCSPICLKYELPT